MHMTLQHLLKMLLPPQGVVLVMRASTQLLPFAVGFCIITMFPVLSNQFVSVCTQNQRN